MTKHSSPLLVEDTNGDVLYQGPLGPAYRIAAEERYIFWYRNPAGHWSVRFCDDLYFPEESEAEWGNSSTLTGAMRYALGALFGPIDDEYDEDALRSELYAERNRL